MCVSKLGFQFQLNHPSCTANFFWGGLRLGVENPQVKFPRTHVHAFASRLIPPPKCFPDTWIRLLDADGKSSSSIFFQMAVWWWFTRVQSIKNHQKKTNPYTSVLLRAPYQIWVGNYNSTCRGEQKPSWKIPVFTHWVPSAPLAANQPSWKPTCHNNPLPHPHHLRQKSGRLDMLTKCSTQKKNSTDSCFLLENKGNSLANLTIPYFWEEICSFVSL